MKKEEASVWELWEICCLIPACYFQVKPKWPSCHWEMNHCSQWASVNMLLPPPLAVTASQCTFSAVSLPVNPWAVHGAETQTVFFIPLGTSITDPEKLMLLWNTNSKWFVCVCEVEVFNAIVEVREFLANKGDCCGWMDLKWSLL